MANDIVRLETVALNQQLTTRAEEFKKALPSHITPEKFQRTVMTAIQTDPDLLKADRQTLLNACMKAAQDGLLPDKREAALVIFTTRTKVNNQWQSVKQVQYMPMVYGLRKKILQSGEVRDLRVGVVYRQEIADGRLHYEEGSEAAFRYQPCLDPDFDPKDEDIALAFSIATFTDGTQSVEVMRRAEINKVRQRSQTGALGKEYDGKPQAPKGPWVDWFSEMAKKSVMRRHSKTLPMSGDLIDVEARDDEIAARSTEQLLGREEPDAPKPLPSRADPPHDPETGELTDEENEELDRRGFDAMEGREQDDGGTETEEQQQEAAKAEPAAKRQAKPKAAPKPAEAKTEPQPTEQTKPVAEPKKRFDPTPPAAEEDEVKAFEKRILNSKTEDELNKLWDEMMSGKLAQDARTELSTIFTNRLEAITNGPAADPGAGDATSTDAPEGRLV